MEPLPAPDEALADGGPLDKLVAVSAGVFEGDPVSGVRYPAPPHMSGWYLTTDRYDGSIRALTVHCLRHVLEARPDLAGFLALAPGHRFWSGEDAGAWFDREVADESAV